jgi:hypothetical protein
MVRCILYVTLQSEHLLPHVASDVIVISHCLNDFFFVVPLEDITQMKIAISRFLSTPSVRKLHSNDEMLQKIPNCIKLDCKPTVGAKDFFVLGFGET